MAKCAWMTCNDVATHGVHCFQHYRQWGLTANYQTAKEVIAKPAPAPIAKKGAKAKAEDKDYKKIVKQMLEEDDRCELRVTVPGVCTKKAEGLHHPVKRSKWTLKDKKNLLRACNGCNSWVESHPKEAEEMGLVKTKFKQTA